MSLYLPEGPLQTADAQSAIDELNGIAIPINSTTSVAYENSRIAKSGAGTLFGFTVYNSLASSQFIQLHNANAVPADAALPLISFTVAGSSNLGVYFGASGRFFTQGIVLCNSTTANSKTIGAANCWFDVQYI